MDTSAPWEPMSAHVEEDLLLWEALESIRDFARDVYDPFIDTLPQGNAHASELTLPTCNGGQDDTAPSLKWPKLLKSTHANGSNKRPKKRDRHELLYLRGGVPELEGRLHKREQQEREAEGRDQPTTKDSTDRNGAR